MEPARTEAQVLSERRGPVLVLTFNRPHRLNAWTDTMEDEYFALLDAADSDPEVRAVVVTGAGRGFCAGADMRRSSARPGPTILGSNQAMPYSAMSPRRENAVVNLAAGTAKRTSHTRA